MRIRHKKASVFVPQELRRDRQKIQKFHHEAAVLEFKDFFIFFWESIEFDS
jgi:hypothetical protein